MTRDNWFDGLKFVLIFFVIFCHSRHFTVTDDSLLSTKFLRYLIHSVYLFHMPLFILISGYFSKKTNKEKFVHSIYRLIRIFIIFHFLWLAVDLLRGEAFSWNRLICPSFTLWYLLSLVYWRCILQIIPEKYDRAAHILPFMFFATLLSGFIPLVNEFSIHRTFTFAPIFFLGYYAKRNNWLEIIRKPNLSWFLLPAIILIFLENRINIDFYGRRPYVEHIDVLKRVLFLCSSIVISIAFVRILPHKVSIFSKEGRDVLFYYVYHSFVLFIIAEMLEYVGYVVGGLGLLIVCLATLMVLYGCKRVKWLRVPL